MGGWNPFGGGRRVAILLALLAAALAPLRVEGQGIAQPTRDDRWETPNGSGGTNLPRYRDAPTVVMVSLDGFRWDFPDLYEAPTLSRIAREGVRSEGMIPVFPSKTFPAHYSMVTGMHPEHHGLVSNSFYDPELDRSYAIRDRGAVEDPVWYRGEPIWVTAETQGRVAGSFFWVGSEAPVAGIRPTHWSRFDDSVPDSVRVDAVLGWLAEGPETRPGIVTLYFSDVDGAAHALGPGHPDVAPAVAKVDRALARLLGGIDALPHRDRILLVVVADHGMAANAPERFIPLDSILDLSGIRVADAGANALLHLDGGGRGRAIAVRDTLNARMQRARAWLREEVPEELHYRADPRIGDIVVIPDPGWEVGQSFRRPRSAGGNHGWDPRLKEMQALFLARGPGLPAGVRIPSFESIHLYPWIASFLGLRANPGADGDAEVIPGLIRDAGAAIPSPASSRGGVSGGLGSS